MFRISTLLFFLIFSLSILAQNTKKDPLKVNLNEEGSHWVKFSFLNQVWVRFNESNPGTTVFEEKQENTFDIGLRRTRFVVQGQVTDKAFFFVQFGQNNFSSLSSRKADFFLHDAVIEYQFHKSLELGMGLSAWGGGLRFSAPSAGSIMGLDTPVYQQITGDVTDQFVRKMSVYLKGKIGRIDYRLALNKPFAFEQSNAFNPNPTINASFAPQQNELQFSSYIKYEFLDKENTKSPFGVGTYLGDKKVLTLGLGLIYQPDAMWYLEGTNTVFADLRSIGVDLYYDTPLGNGTAISAYLAYLNNDLGRNFTRNVGVMNPANGVIESEASLNGAGNAFPMHGTGNSIYTQFGYMLKKDLLGEKAGTLMPYCTFFLGDYERLDDLMIVGGVGVNWLINKHKNKFTFGYENRPIFKTDTNNNLVSDERKGMWVLQYQIKI